MIKRTVTYTDYNGNEVTEELHFNLNKIELSEMDLEYDGKLSEYLEKIVNDQDAKKIYKTFKELILSAYGIKSEDGKHFLKNEKIREEFASSEAFAEFFFGLIGSDEAAMTSFIKGILPAEANNGQPLPPAVK